MIYMKVFYFIRSKSTVNVVALLIYYFIVEEKNSFAICNKNHFGERRMYFNLIYFLKHERRTHTIAALKSSFECVRGG